MHSNELRITKDRISVVIGKQGSTKRQIESKTKTKLNIDSKEGNVTISGEDSLNVYNTVNIITGISRGFNPRIALLLLKENFVLEIIDIRDFSGKSKLKQIRIKSRVIGKKGKARGIIEEITNTHISIYGKTVSIIGEVERVFVARRAVEMLLSGSKHSSVFSWLERQHDKKVFE